MLLLACSKGGSTDSGNNSHPYSGSNGIVINGGVYDNISVDFNGSGDAKYPTDTRHPPGQIRFSGIVDGEETIFEMGVPSATAETFTWSSVGMNNLKPDSYMTITIGGSGGTIFHSTRGKTVVSQFGTIGGPVSGSFSGTLRSPDGTRSIDVNGRFFAERF
jgi:hypothetical protein